MGIALFVIGLSEKQKIKIGAQIGIFIKALHAIGCKGKSPNSENAQINWLLESYRKKSAY